MSFLFFRPSLGIVRAQKIDEGIADVAAVVNVHPGHSKTHQHAQVNRLASGPPKCLVSLGSFWRPFKTQPKGTLKKRQAQALEKKGKRSRHGPSSKQNGVTGFPFGFPKKTMPKTSHLYHALEKRTKWIGPTRRVGVQHWFCRVQAIVWVESDQSANKTKGIQEVLSVKQSMHT